MSLLFRRSQPITCYYCQSAVAPSPSSPSFSTFVAPGASNAGSFNPSFFQCPHCRCWNRYNEHGEIVSDEPAMHDERLNVDSFSKRGSPDRNRLPSVYKSSGTRREGFFCHTCQTNQNLLVNLLSNYLPSPEDASYRRRVAELPAYSASVQARYPPVCQKCLPAVNEEIARKDEMARTRALAGALQASNQRGPRAANSSTLKRAGKQAKMNTWRSRGVLWVTTLLITIAGYTIGVLDFRMSHHLHAYAPWTLAFALLSMFWTFWDPTYSLQQRPDAQGRHVRIEGRRNYVILQCFSWITRLVTAFILFIVWAWPETRYLPSFFANRNEDSSDFLKRRFYFGALLILELVVLVLSYFAITIHRPAPIRLIDTSASRGLSPFPESAPSSTTHTSFPKRSYTPSPQLPSSSNLTNLPVMSERDLFATLSLSSDPTITNYAASAIANPMFGKPSLPSPAFASEYAEPQPQALAAPRFSPKVNIDFDDEDYIEDLHGPTDPDAMDWEPASPVAKRTQAQGRGTQASADDASWLRRQRFFPPEVPTGLESLLMRTRLVDEDEGQHHTSRHPGQESDARHGNSGWNWNWVYSLSIAPLVLLTIGLWIGSADFSQF